MKSGISGMDVTMQKIWFQVILSIIEQFWWQLSTWNYQESVALHMAMANKIC